MLRKTVEARTADPDPLTIRTAVEWFKDQVNNPYSPLTVAEREYIDGRWGSLMKKLAEEHEVPVGWLGYMLSELAQREIAMLRIAQAESTV